MVKVIKQQQQIQFILQMKDQNQNQLNYVPSKYTKSLQNYTKTQLPTVMNYLSVIAQTSSYASKFPVYKILKAIATKFMINEIQAVFLAYLISETNWQIKEKIILHNIDNIKDILSIKIQHPEFRCLSLYLVLCGYTVKYYLNQDITQALEEANKACFNFKPIFQLWAKNHEGLTARISPKTLNEVYNKLFNQSRVSNCDFNRIVDAIVQISPAYNSDRVKEQPVSNVKQAIVMNICDKMERQKSGFSFVNSGMMPAPLFTSSCLEHMGTNELGQAQNALNNFFKSQRPNSRYLAMMNSSVAGMSNYNLALGAGDDNGNCLEINLGLQEGQSEQNITFANRNQDQGPLTSVITLSRGISFTERYLAQSQSFVTYKDTKNDNKE